MNTTLRTGSLSATWQKTRLREPMRGKLGYKKPLFNTVLPEWLVTYLDTEALTYDAPGDELRVTQLVRDTLFYDAPGDEVRTSKLTMDVLFYEPPEPSSSSAPL